jgi:hypothetical protein
MRTATTTILAAATTDVMCPTGDQVIRGGSIQGAHNGIVTSAIPIHEPKPGFEVHQVLFGQELPQP